MSTWPEGQPAARPAAGGSSITDGQGAGRQALALASFASQAAEALRRVPSDLAGLLAGSAFAVPTWLG